MTKLSGAVGLTCAVACHSAGEVEEVARLDLRQRDTVVVQGAAIPADRLFRAVTTQGVEAPGAIRLSADQPGWRVRPGQAGSPDTLIAPTDQENRTTVTARAGGLTATARAAAVFDLRARRWRWDEFCDCTRNERRSCTETLTSVDSIRQSATIDAFVIRPGRGPGADSTLPASIDFDATSGRLAEFRNGVSFYDGPIAGQGNAPGFNLANPQTLSSRLGVVYALVRVSPRRYEGQASASPNALCAQRPDRPAVLEEVLP